MLVILLKFVARSEEHTSELQSHLNIVCRLLLEKHTPTHSDTHHRAALLAHRTITLHTQQHTRHTHTHAHTDTHRETHTHTNRGTFFFNDTATTEIYTLSLHDALPI